MSIARIVIAGLGIAAVGAVAAYAQSNSTEEPDYETVVSDGKFELRDYGPLVVAQVTHTGARQRASSASFRRLAAYIFGQDRPAGGEDIAMTSPVISQKVDQNEKIAMTSPVLQENTDGDTWRMRFVMPEKYTLETLPEAPEDITLTEVPARRMAAIRFSGNANETDLIVKEQELSDWIAALGLTTKGGFEYAFYDAPMVPGPLRRNEILVEVAAE